jgi:hypothetical protein
MTTREFRKCKKHDLRMRGMKLTRIGNKLIPIDKRIRRLIVELSRVGLETCSCCEGHGKTEAWISFTFKNIKEVKVYPEGFSVVWQRKKLP